MEWTRQLFPSRCYLNEKLSLICIDMLYHTKFKIQMMASLRTRVWRILRQPSVEPCLREVAFNIFFFKFSQYLFNLTKKKKYQQKKTKNTHYLRLPSQALSKGRFLPCYIILMALQFTLCRSLLFTLINGSLRREKMLPSRVQKCVWNVCCSNQNKHQKFHKTVSLKNQPFRAEMREAITEAQCEIIISFICKSHPDF